jgi:hypothetical protein
VQPLQPPGRVLVQVPVLVLLLSFTYFLSLRR